MTALLDSAASARQRRVVVVGTGMVGRRVARLLHEDTCGHAWRLAQLSRLEPGEPIVGGLAPGDVVVLAGGGLHASIAAAIADHGASVVSVSDDLADIRELLDLDDRFRAAGSTVVVGAAMSPGLSGLLLRLLARRLHLVDEIHVAVHATAGPACARRHHRSLAGRAVGWHDGRWIERPAGSGRELCWFPEPVGAHDCYRAEMSDPLLMHRSDPDVARISARMSATRRDRLTARLPMLRPPHPEGGVGALRVEVRGAATDGSRVGMVAGVAELVGAAAGATAAAFARVLLDQGTPAALHAGPWVTVPSGVLISSDPMLPIDRLLHHVVRGGVRLQEFTGDAQT